MYKGAVDGRSQGAFHLQPRRPVPTWAPSVNCSTHGLGPGLFGLGTRVAGAIVGSQTHRSRYAPTWFASDHYAPAFSPFAAGAFLLRTRGCVT